MFCPRCGKGEQIPDSYCRQCGLLLPNLSQLVKREIPPGEHLKANTALSVLTIIASFTLSFLLFAILGFSSATHPLIYATAGVLIAIGGWHIQTFIRTQKLKQQWKRRTPLTESETSSPQPTFKSGSTAKLLDESDLSATPAASVTENSTRDLVRRSGS